MNTIVVAILIGALQDPAPDEVAKQFPDPVPADRAWEMAAEYHRRIGEAIRREAYDEAREWERKAVDRLPRVYGSHIAEMTRHFWGFQGSPPRNPDHARLAREHALRSLGVEAPPPRVGDNPQDPWLPLTHAAWLLAFQDRFDAAIELISAIEKSRPGGSWPKEMIDVRREIASLKEAGKDPKALAAMAWRAGFAGSGSHQAAFCALRKLKGAADEASLKSGAAYLRAIHDEDGARAWEDRLFNRPDVAPEETASIVLKRANDAFARGDFATADTGFRRILKEWPGTITWGRALYNLGFSLMKQKRYPEARAEFEKLLKADVNDAEPGDHIMELKRNYRPKAIVHIGECYEAEGNWDKALEAYQDQGRFPMHTGCGNCDASIAIQSQSRIARALVGLGREREAMKVVRKILFMDGALGGPSPEMAILGVDLAVRAGTSDEFARELEQLKGGNGTVARDYLRVLRLRAASDHEGLYELIRLRAVYAYQNNWEDARKGNPIGVEALECLGELGDPALDWVIEKYRTSPADRTLALTAIAHFKNAKALEFIRAVPVRPHTNDASQLRMLEAIHAAPSRQRTYPAKAIKAQDFGMGISGVLMAVLLILGFARRFAHRRASA